MWPFKQMLDTGYWMLKPQTSNLKPQTSVATVARPKDFHSWGLSEGGLAASPLQTIFAPNGNQLYRKGIIHLQENRACRKRVAYAGLPDRRICARQIDRKKN